MQLFALMQGPELIPPGRSVLTSSIKNYYGSETRNNPSSSKTQQRTEHILFLFSRTVLKVSN